MLNAAKTLDDSGIPSAREEAELLLADLTGWDRSSLYIDRTKSLTPEQSERYNDWVARRSTGEPYAHIVGFRDFYKHRFSVSADTLIPRGDSETMVEAVLCHVGQDQSHRILDLGTGSGCLLLSLLHEMPNAKGIGVDINPEALKVAANNATSVGCSDRVSWQQSDWFENIKSEDGLFTILLSNPPYIPSEDILSLDSGVKDFEPRLALDGGAGGLDCYAIILANMEPYLQRDSLIAFEVGIHQANDIVDMMKSAGLVNCKTFKDLGQIDRVVMGTFA